MSEVVFAHRQEIDGLRAVAVLPVIWHHAALPGLPGGFLGVDVFFVISGYLITGILVADLSADRFSIGRFYERRVRRLLPALIFTLLFSLPLAIWLLLPGQLVKFGESLLSVTLFLSNVYFWQSTNYFAESASLQPLLHTWILAVEEQFYLFFPLVLWMLYGRSRSALVTVLITATVVSFAISIWASHAMPVANFYLLPTRAWELLVGALCVFLGSKAEDVPGGIAALLAAVGLVMIISAMIVLDDSWGLPSYPTLMVVAGTSFIIVFARSGQGLIGRLLIVRPIVGVGLISYSAYLFHQPLMAFARIGWPDLTGPVLMGFLAFATLVFAAVSWRFVEQPFRRKSGPILASNRGVFTLGIAASAAAAIIGVVLIATKGFAIRYEPEDRDLALLDRQAAGAYVRERFNERRLRPFDQGEHQRLLLIGDSFAQDFLNILSEAGVAQDFTISTHHVSKQCGNLLVAGDLSEFVVRAHAALCMSEGGLARAELQPLIVDASVIVLASDWQPWQWEHLAETHANLSLRTDADIFVLGRKDFGAVHLRSLLDMPVSRRLAIRNSANPLQTQADELLRASLGPHFIDLQAALCPDGDGCELFTQQGDLVSYDGGHLTRAGAQWAGPRVLPILPFVQEIAQ